MVLTRLSARECGVEAVGLLAVHDLMSEAEVSGTVLGHSTARVFSLTVIMDVNEGIIMLSLVLRKCSSTISTMLPTITSNAEQMGMWYAQALKASEETGMARGDFDQQQ